MSLYSVLVNGVPQFVGGSTAAPLQSNVGVAVTSSGGGVAAYNVGAPGASNYERTVLEWTGNFGELGTEAGGTGSTRSCRVKTLGTLILNAGGADKWQVMGGGNGAFLPTSSGIQPDLGSSNIPVGNLWLSPTKRLDFGQTASTFAQTATLTNGPRAANPVAWVEVSYNAGGSTGRIPIW